MEQVLHAHLNSEMRTLNIICSELLVILANVTIS